MTGPVGKRYARALFALAAEQGSFERVGEELARVAEAFRRGELASLARSATVDAKTKRTITRQVAGPLGASTLVGNFLGLLAEKNRLRFLDPIEAHYRALVDRKLGRLRAVVRTAKPLDDESAARLRALFEAKTAKQVLAEVVVDPELLGGVIVEIEGRAYDGSLRTQLEGLKAALSG